MNAKTAGANVAPIIEDVQGRADTRRIPIDRVGIKDIFHPVRVKNRSGGHQHTIANFNMYVYLPDNFKGTHMSRFVEILHAEREISVDSFRAMLERIAEPMLPARSFALTPRLVVRESCGAYLPRARGKSTPS